jgi:hypothetical protein
MTVARKTVTSKSYPKKGNSRTKLHSAQHQAKKAMTRSKNHYAVLTADITDSRTIENFPSARDQKLRPLAKAHLKRRFILSEYAVTAWDEFEGILTDLRNIPEVILDLRRRFYPMRLRIGIGFGEVSDPSGTPVNAFAGGRAFERAREAIKKLNGERVTRARSTLIISDDDEFDAIVNAVYQLHDTLVDQIKPKQWAIINARMEEKGQESTARRVGLNKSLVSRLLKRGHYSELITTKQVVRTIITHYWGLHHMALGADEIA